MINSSLVSAQNRKRLYWTNIPGVGQPDDLQINLTDVLEEKVAYENSKRQVNLKDYNGEVAINPRNFGGKGYVGTNTKSVALTEPSGNNATLVVQKPISQPEDKGILLKDVLEDNVNDSYNLSEKANKRCIENPRSRAFKKNQEKSGALLSNQHKQSTDSLYAVVKEPVCGRIVGRKINLETGKRDDYNPNLKIEQRIEARLDEKSGTLTTVQKDNVLIVPEATKKGYTEIQDGDCFDATFINSKTRRGRNMKDKSNCLTAANYDYMRYEHPTYRKLTPIECERLQTLPDNYTDGVSDTQRYKALGNGWTVDVIVHILQGLKWQN
jgi:DNA (cytosine-5)-methyltransferase 3A